VRCPREITFPLIIALAVAVAGCDQGRYLLVVRFDPEGLADEVDRVDVAVVESCDGQPTESGGDPVGVTRQVWVERAGAGEDLGRLDPGRYGLYGRGRSTATCSIVAAGCTEIEVEAGGEGTLELELTAVSGPGCDPGEQCEAGLCVAPDGGPECTRHADCDDGAFCNGAETCDPEAPGADPTGCVLAAAGPCNEHQICEEATDRCVTSCEVTSDSDDDGHDAVECGGADCDDSEATVYPGAEELCNERDDDCDDATDEDFDLDTDVDNCGACGTVCGDDNATPSCAAGACTLACDAGFESCDDSFSSGCETGTTSNPEHCGACDVPCLLSCESSSCVVLDAVSLSAGGGHACAVHRSGEVFCWGANGRGQLGDGTTAESLTPVLVSGLDDAVSVSAGSEHTCAVRASGSAVCWGRNDEGQLGGGGRVDSSIPVAVSGLSSVAEVGAGEVHSCARLESGALRCWGSNDSGQIGDSTAADRPTPAVVDDITDAVDLSVGHLHSCAARASGAVFCWGDNGSGQLGDGTTTEARSPVAATGVTGAIEVGSGSSHTCARLGAGELRCWGCDDLGQLGDGATVPAGSCSCVGGGSECSLGALTVAGALVATGLSAGASHGCAWDAAGAPSCWGDGRQGAIGDGGTEIRHEPTPVTGLTGASVVDGGDGFACAIDGSGAVQCWGRGEGGRLGDGTTADRALPAPISDI